MSYTDSGFDKRVRNLLVAPSPAPTPPPPPPAPQPPAGAYVWLTGDALVGNDGDPIASWVNSGSGPNALVAPPTPAPVILDDGTLRGAFFDGTSALAWVGTLDFTLTPGITVCGVLLSTSSPGGNLISSFQTRDWGMFYDVNSLGVYTTVSVESDAVFPNLALYAFEMQQPRDSSDVPRFWKNGTTAAGAGSSFIGSIEDAPLATALGVYVGGGFGWAGVIADFLIYKRQFDAADRAAWAAYIADKYGL